MIKPGHRSGQSHHRATLTDDQVRAMREAYIPGKIGYGRLAKMFNCGESTARDIVNYATRYKI